MDGNGRWAKKQGKKRIEGHKVGAEVVKSITTYCSNHKDIQRLTLYAFSTENWKRDEKEIEGILNLIRGNFVKLREDFDKKKFDIRKTKNATG